MATAILADFGAEVIKVEEPGGGRRAREERRLRGEAEDVYSSEELERRRLSPFERGKRSIALDLKQAEGRHIALSLVTSADVVVEGFRPGVMARLGLAWEDVKKANPRVVYCSITGYGQDGPRSDRVGHDLNYLADAGALSLFADRDAGRPIIPPNLVADYAGGSLQAVIGILGALFSRTTTGLGQFVDVSLSDGVLALLAPEASTFAATGRVPQGGKTRLTGSMAYYGVYETSDGRYISLGCNEPAFFRALCAELGLEHLVRRQQDTDPAWQEQAREAIQSKLATATLDDWEKRFAGKEIAYAPVRTIDEVLVDAHYLARSVVHGGQKGARSARIGSPYHLSETPVVSRFDVPLPGEDTRELLRSIGRDGDAVARLFEAGVVA